MSFYLYLKSHLVYALILSSIYVNSLYLSRKTSTTVITPKTITSVSAPEVTSETMNDSMGPNPTRLASELYKSTAGLGRSSQSQTTFSDVTKEYVDNDPEFITIKDPVTGKITTVRLTVDLIKDLIVRTRADNDSIYHDNAYCITRPSMSLFEGQSWHSRLHKNSISNRNNIRRYARGDSLELSINSYATEVHNSTDYDGFTVKYRGSVMNYDEESNAPLEYNVMKGKFKEILKGADFESIYSNISEEYMDNFTGIIRVKRIQIEKRRTIYTEEMKDMVKSMRLFRKNQPQEREACLVKPDQWIGDNTLVGSRAIPEIGSLKQIFSAMSGSPLKVIKRSDFTFRDHSFIEEYENIISDLNNDLSGVTVEFDLGLFSSFVEGDDGFIKDPRAYRALPCDFHDYHTIDRFARDALSQGFISSTYGIAPTGMGIVVYRDRYKDREWRQVSVEIGKFYTALEDVELLFTVAQRRDDRRFRIPDDLKISYIYRFADQASGYYPLFHTGVGYNWIPGVSADKANLQIRVTYDPENGVEENINLSELDFSPGFVSAANVLCGETNPCVCMSRSTTEWQDDLVLVDSTPELRCGPPTIYGKKCPSINHFYIFDLEEFNDVKIEDKSFFVKPFYRTDPEEVSTRLSLPYPASFGERVNAFNLPYENTMCSPPYYAAIELNSLKLINKTLNLFGINDVDKLKLLLKLEPELRTCVSFGYCFILCVRDSCPSKAEIDIQNKLNGLISSTNANFKTQERLNRDMSYNIDNNSKNIQTVAATQGELIAGVRDLTYSFQEFSSYTHTSLQNVEGSVSAVTNQMIYQSLIFNAMEQEDLLYNLADNQTCEEFTGGECLYLGGNCYKVYPPVGTPPPPVDNFTLTTPKLETGVSLTQPSFTIVSTIKVEGPSGSVLSPLSIGLITVGCIVAIGAIALIIYCYCNGSPGGV